MRSNRPRPATGIVFVLIALLAGQACGHKPAAPATAVRGVPSSGVPVPVPGPVDRAPRPGIVGAESSCARFTLDRMTLAARVGQLVMVGVPAGDPAAGRATVTAYQLGGVFLTGRSLLGITRTRAAVDALQRAAAPSGPRLDVALDMEGGAVLTLRGPGMDYVPSARQQARLPAARLAQTTVRWSGELHRAGITLDLAPVADTVAAADKPSNPPIGAFDREYGATAASVGSRVATVVSAMSSAGLGSTLKHFPGLGRVRYNTDVSTGARDSRATVTDANLRPFAEGIAAGATAVMVSSAGYPLLDHVNIAAFSWPIITGLLRDRMGFGGLVLSLPVGLRAVLFVGAGGDVALTVRMADARLMTAELLTRARASTAFRGKVDAAALRVLTSKAKRHLLTC